MYHLQTGARNHVVHCHLDLFVCLFINNKGPRYIAQAGLEFVRSASPSASASSVAGSAGVHHRTVSRAPFLSQWSFVIDMSV